MTTETCKNDPDGNPPSTTPPEGSMRCPGWVTKAISALDCTNPNDFIKLRDWFGLVIVRLSEVEWQFKDMSAERMRLVEVIKKNQHDNAASLRADLATCRKELALYQNKHTPPDTVVQEADMLRDENQRLLGEIDELRARIAGLEGTPVSPIYPEEVHMLRKEVQRLFRFLKVTEHLIEGGEVFVSNPPSGGSAE